MGRPHRTLHTTKRSKTAFSHRVAFISTPNFCAEALPQPQQVRGAGVPPELLAQGRGGSAVSLLVSGPRRDSKSVNDPTEQQVEALETPWQQEFRATRNTSVRPHSRHG